MREEASSRLPIGVPTTESRPGPLKPVGSPGGLPPSAASARRTLRWPPRERPGTGAVWRPARVRCWRSCAPRAVLCPLRRRRRTRRGRGRRVLPGCARLPARAKPPPPAGKRPSRGVVPRGLRGRRRREAARTSSDVESDLEHVAVGHLVVLALDAELARLLGPRPRSDLQELVPADHLGADEPALEVRVDDPGALGGLGAGPEGPRPALLVPGGEERAPTEQVVGGPRHPGEGAFTQAEAFEQLGALAGRQLGRFGLELHADAEHVAVAAQLVGDRLDEGLGVFELVLAEVD